jgi:hypothetical protein
MQITVQDKHVDVLKAIVCEAIATVDKRKMPGYMKVTVLDDLKEINKMLDKPKANS